MHRQVEHLVVGDLVAQSQLQHSGELERAGVRLGIGLLDRRGEDLVALGQLLTLLHPDEEIAQVGDEPRGADGVAVERPAVRLLQHIEQLPEQAGDPVGLRQVTGGEPGVDQVQRDGDRLVVGDRLVESCIDVRHDVGGGGELLGVEVGDLGAQRVVEDHPGGHPLDREAQVVGQSHHHVRGQLGVELVAGDLQRLVGQDDVLGRDGGDLGAQVVRVAAVVGDEGPRDAGRVHAVAGPGPEAQAASGQDDLLAGRVPRQHDVVVEHAEDLHGEFLRPAGVVASAVAVAPAPGQLSVAPLAAISSRYQSNDFFR
ncbi:hypothetical protein SDC9_122690 [bioreactor metagenome]|uniref:Uncharacterized protein n=1 Tax=bioreactor metagenome TaxID=1076179 RepID=A0A645CFE6_9ZZZZ